MVDLHPDSVVIERLGGPSEVARLCRIRPQAVSQWKKTGIPGARRDFLQLLRPAAFSELATESARAA